MINVQLQKPVEVETKELTLCKEELTYHQELNVALEEKLDVAESKNEVLREYILVCEVKLSYQHEKNRELGEKLLLQIMKMMN